ncbi:MAG: isoaspartyl peptidase/L-asparaginase family protein [Burkholderiales bacterium]
MGYAIVIHGGAGAWEAEGHEAAIAGVRGATAIARDVLATGGAALDSVVAAVVALEDNPLFNAGTGSCLNLDGDAEMDAQVMDGQHLRAGAVAAIRRIRNPVLVARKVMEETGHVLLAGEGALRFARALGFDDHDPVTQRARERWRERRDELNDDPSQSRAPGINANSQGGTVGAVAVDGQGRLAAATSTGGLTLKLPGRVGDTPVPGAGNYATAFAAASATGHGELMMRTLATKRVCDWIERGLDAQAAVEAVLEEMADCVGAEAGLIAVDRLGGIGVAHRTARMPFAYAREGDVEITAAIAR